MVNWVESRYRDKFKGYKWQLYRKLYGGICLLAPQNQGRLSSPFVRNSFCTATVPDQSGQLYIAVKKRGPLFRSKLQSLLHYFLGIRRGFGFNYYPQTDGHTKT